MTAVVLRGDARHLPLPSDSVDLICTSPPFLNLRSYTDSGEHYDGQIGTGTRDSFLNDLWGTTAEMARVLKPTGSIFVELGDSYSAKSLEMSPHRYAIGCVDKLGLILRAEIVWNKANGLPESVTDRVRRAHSVVFHFTRLPRYFAAVDEIREAYSENKPWGRRTLGRTDASRGDTGQADKVLDWKGTENPLGKLPGSVWTIPSAPLTVPPHLGIDHFAAFPMELPRRIILGWSPSEICVECGEGRRPVVDRRRSTNDRNRIDLGAEGRTRRLGVTSGLKTNATAGGYPPTIITGHACACPDVSAPTRPAVVLDPFGGTGTTSLVADMLGRTGISLDRSADYCRLARWRTTDPAERARALGVPKPPPVIPGQLDLLTGEAS